MKTPVRVPRSVSGTMPARSNASQPISRTIRCCGSMPSASRGLMPKNAASNRAASYRNPPERAYVVFRCSGEGW